MKTIVFGNLRDAETGEILKIQVEDHEAKGLDVVVERARKSAQKFVAYGFAQK